MILKERVETNNMANLCIVQVGMSSWERTQRI